MRSASVRPYCRPRWLVDCIHVEETGEEKGWHDLSDANELRWANLAFSTRLIYTALRAVVSEVSFSSGFGGERTRHHPELKNSWGLWGRTLGSRPV